MIKSRLCFVLLYFDKSFCVSRNFKLQKVGDIDWLMKKYDFEKILKVIDELIILNINKSEKDENQYNAYFFDCLDKLLKKAFLPVSIGGSLKDFDNIKKLFNSGADKVVLNRSFYHNKELIKKIVDTYGSQSLVASLDYTGSGLEKSQVMVDNGKNKSQLSIKECIKIFNELSAGELMINSIDRDGLGYGYDFDTLEEISKVCKMPIIAAGGADNDKELLKGISANFINAVSTSHLFNFMGSGLEETRDLMIKKGANLPLR